MILNSMGFTFNGIHSSDMGVVMVNLSTGLFTEQFIAPREIQETRINNRGYYKGVVREVLSFPFNIYVEKWKDWKHLRSVARWLDVDDYCEFFTDSDPERIYYVQPQGDSDIVHNGAREGYIEMEMISETQFTYSPYVSYDLIINGSNSLFLSNEGDLITRPYLVIKKIGGDGDISIKNEQTGETFTIRELWDNEVVYVDCLSTEIESIYEEKFNRYLFDKHNGVWLDFHEQVQTVFTMTGNFELNFKFRQVYLSELGTYGSW